MSIYVRESPCLPILFIRDRLEPENGQGRPKATWGRKFIELQQTRLLISCLKIKLPRISSAESYEIPSCRLNDFHGLYDIGYIQFPWFHQVQTMSRSDWATQCGNCLTDDQWVDFPGYIKFSDILMLFSFPFY